MSPSVPQKPLRTALIGLSSSAATSWASAAHLPNFQIDGGKQRFAITALLNSSEDAAKKAVSAYNLSAETKTYGKPEDLANDAAIDFVVCNTRVDKHYQTTLSSIKAGKDAYIEWPVAGNQQHIQELVDAAKQSGARVAIGLQRRWAPPILKIKEIVSSGRLGKILSSELRQYGGTVDREKVASGIKYFADRSVGGNVITISVGHAIDFAQSVVGELVKDTVQTRLELQRPEVLVRDPQTGDIIETIRSNVPDLLSLHGRISSPHASENATLNYLFRRGQPFPGTPVLDWRINFEKGEARLSSVKATGLEADPSEILIQIHHFDTDEVENIPWEWSEEQKQVPYSARNVLSSLFAFADGKEAVEGWVSVEDAARRAEQIEGWLRSSGW